MPARLHALCIDAHDPPTLARFWSGLLRREISDDGLVLLPADDTGFRIRFVPTAEPKLGPNPIHLDLASTSWEEQQETVDRALALGGSHLDVGQLPEEEHVVLADPEGNEMCVVEPGNGFLAGCGLEGCLSSDGSAAVGRFWSAALGWPLVWDQDEETAIQSPAGGTKISWGGPPYHPKQGPTYRLHLEVAPVDGDQQSEVERLVSLGATRVDVGHTGDGRVTLADPDGHELCVLPAR